MAAAQPPQAIAAPEEIVQEVAVPFDAAAPSADRVALRSLVKAARFPAGVDDGAMQAAIEQAIDADAASLSQKATPAHYGAERYEAFARDFAEAKVPDCLHGDALKRQPPRILFVEFRGAYAIPFVILAKLRGKCI